MTGTAKGDAFSVSLNGAMKLDIDRGDLSMKESKNARALLSVVNGVDEQSIISAYKLSGYDVCYRAKPAYYKPVENINPGSDEVYNIIIMVNRSVSFLKEYGPIVKSGFTFEGGYTDVITSGDGDYLTKDTLWDFKASKNKPSSADTLQVLVYHIMGLHSGQEEFKSIEKLGIYNPRLNTAYIIDVGAIPKSVIEEIEQTVIGYKKDV